MVRQQVLSLIFLGVTTAANSQSSPQTPSSPASGSSAHQRDATQTSVDEAQPTVGSDPGSIATPHQQRVTQAPGRGALASPMFVTMAAQSGMTEVELGKLALNKSSNADVKQFADTMVKDHTKANDELRAIASSKQLDVPSGLDADHAAMVKSMSSKSGKDFDSAYAKHMVADHDKAITLFKSETKDTDKELAAFAQKTLPILQNHQQMAQRLPST
jgi:putative membrane protein